MSRKRAITPFLSRKFMITRSSIAFEDFLGSSIAPQVMPPCSPHCRPDLISLHFANVVICVEFCFTLWKSAFLTFGFETEQAADEEAVQCFALGKDDLLLRLATGVDDQ